MEMVICEVAVLVNLQGCSGRQWGERPALRTIQ